MIYVFEGGSIVYDGSTISEEEKRQAVAIKELPIEKNPSGMKSLLRVDKLQNKVWYEYVEDDEITKLQKLLDDALELLLEMEVL